MMAMVVSSRDASRAHGLPQELGEVSIGLHGKPLRGYTGIVKAGAMEG